MTFIEIVQVEFAFGVLFYVMLLVHDQISHIIRGGTTWSFFFDNSEFNIKYELVLFLGLLLWVPILVSYGVSSLYKALTRRPLNGLDADTMYLCTSCGDHVCVDLVASVHKDGETVICIQCSEK